MKKPAKEVLTRGETLWKEALSRKVVCGGGVESERERVVEDA